jgi:hypothetical protein
VLASWSIITSHLPILKIVYIYISSTNKSLMNGLSSMFSRPLLIYDDTCSSCTSFARAIGKLSGGWIRIGGHYYSEQAKQAKILIFPTHYDPTRFFWLINRKGAYGARSGLLPVIGEIFKGLLKTLTGERKEQFNQVTNSVPECYYDKKKSCSSTAFPIRKVIAMMQNGAKFRFNN